MYFETNLIPGSYSSHCVIWECSYILLFYLNCWLAYFRPQSHTHVQNIILASIPDEYATIMAATVRGYGFPRDVITSPRPNFR